MVGRWSLFLRWCIRVDQDITGLAIEVFTQCFQSVEVYPIAFLTHVKRKCRSRYPGFI